MSAAAPDPRAAAATVALWVFLGVASTLFLLFLVAYGMRIDAGDDWAPLALPWPLVPGTALLAAGSVAIHHAARAAAAGRSRVARRALAAGGAAVLGFLAAQLAAWDALADAGVTLRGNPAASFYYLLTALHGLHVAGGLVLWGVAADALRGRAPPPAWRVRLCARYWHFLLAVWLVLLATLAGLTPALVRALCGTG